MSSAVVEWKSRSSASDEQWERVRAKASTSTDDEWAGHHDHFRADPHRTGDPILERLLKEVTDTTTVIDVGGGAGRYALPLALRCREVTVVEPSEGMMAGLREGMEEAGISNVTALGEAWDEAEVEPADTVLCADVAHHVFEIELFLGKLASHARDKVLLLEHVESPGSWVAPFWKPVHGEDYMDPPGLPEMMRVLWQMNIYPDLEMLTTSKIEAVKDKAEALQMLRRYVYVREGTEEDTRLKAAVDELMVSTDEGLAMKDVRPMRQVLISWRPSDS